MQINLWRATIYYLFIFIFCSPNSFIVLPYCHLGLYPLFYPKIPHSLFVFLVAKDRSRQQNFPSHTYILFSHSNVAVSNFCFFGRDSSRFWYINMYWGLNVACCDVDMCVRMSGDIFSSGSETSSSSSRPRLIMTGMTITTVVDGIMVSADGGLLSRRWCSD